MIITEKISDTLKKTYSDAGFMIQQQQTGALYDEAIDIIDASYTYIETDIRDESGDEATVEDYQAALKELGVE